MELPKKGEVMMDFDQQRRFQKGIGSLLYLTRNSRPDIMNAVRDLSRVMKSGTPGYFKRLLRVIKYVELTKKEELLTVHRATQSGISLVGQIWTGRDALMIGRVSLVSLLS